MTMWQGAHPLARVALLESPIGWSHSQCTNGESSSPTSEFQSPHATSRIRCTTATSIRFELSALDAITCASKLSRRRPLCKAPPTKKGITKDACDGIQG